MEINSTTDLNGNHESAFKSIVQERLTTLIKSKFEKIDGAKYDCKLKDYQLLKSDNGLFSILIPTVKTNINGLTIYTL